MVLATATTAFAAYNDTAGHWAERDIDWATQQGYLKGDGNGNFRPEDTVTRAEYVTGVNRLINSTSKSTIGYADVKSGNWYYDEIAKGVYNGIIDDSRYDFRPNEAISRDEAAKIMARAYRLTNYADGATIFKDYANIINKGEVGALVIKKVLNGWTDGNYYPGKTLTRAEYAKVLRAAVVNLGLPSKTTPVASKPSTRTDWYYGRDYYRYYGCESELSSLASAIRSGKLELPKTGTYSAASLEVLKKAVADGELVYDKYKDYKSDYRYGYDYGYRIYPWNYSTLSAFERAMRAEYPNVFTSAEIRDIYDNYKDGYYYGYYGYGVNPKDYATFTSFERAMKNKYPGVFSSSQLEDIWNGNYRYYGDRSYYYDYCPDQGTINAATKRINDAIAGLKKIGTDPCAPEDPCTPPVDPCDPCVPVDPCDPCAVKYDITYKFEAAEAGQSLPAKVTALLPAATKATKGTNVTPKLPAETEVEVEGGKWTFGSYTPASVTKISKDQEFVGTWNYAATEEPPAEEPTDGDAIQAVVESGAKETTIPFDETKYTANADGRKAFLFDARSAARLLFQREANEQGVTVTPTANTDNYNEETDKQDAKATVKVTLTKGEASREVIVTVTF